MSVFSKGFKFVPFKLSVNKYNERLFRCLRWTSFPGHSPKRQVNPNDDIFAVLFCSPKQREPPRDEYTEVQCCIDKCLNDTHGETTALVNTQNRDVTVAKPAGK